jgi:hypothetical protein
MKMNRLSILIGLALLLVVAGCEMETRVVRSTWDSLPADPKPDYSGNPDRDPAGVQGWSIQVAQIAGPTRHDQARELVAHLRSRLSMANLWIEDLGGIATVYHGRYTKASDPAIRRDLKKVQQAELDGKKPFANSKPVPLAGGGQIITDPYDLRQFIGYYSLQIGFYDEAFGKDFRQAAEQAVRVLREDGYDAYYYHGPFRSIITIGIFSYEQAFVTVGTHDTYAPQIRELQKKFPYNLGNGVTLIQKEGGRNIGEQKSSLIKVF